MMPIIPGKMPSTPPSAQLGNHAGRRRLRIKAAIAGPFARGKNAGLAFEPENRTVDVGLAQQHAGVVHQVARGKVVGAVGDDVVVLQNVEGVGAREHGLVLDHVDRGIQRGEFFFGGIELLTAHVAGGVQDLALQIAGIDHIEIDQPQRANAGRGQVERQRRAQSARAHAQDARGLQLLLALHAHFRQDQVARVARELVARELR